MKNQTNRIPAFSLFLVLSLFLILGTTSCHKKQYLTGYYTWGEFRSKAQWETFVDQRYNPDQKYIDSLEQLHVKDSLHVKLFLGTYCHDSKKWVPRFYRLKPMLPVGNVEIISVDTTKKDERGYYKDVKLDKIPTFVFYNPAGTEVGRIVEKPKGGLEKQLYRVLKKAE
jgi:thiol-disulfide isomerase/thioredoxin